MDAYTQIQSLLLKTESKNPDEIVAMLSKTFTGLKFSILYTSDTDFTLLVQGRQTNFVIDVDTTETNPELEALPYNPEKKLSSFDNLNGGYSSILLTNEEIIQITMNPNRDYSQTKLYSEIMYNNLN